MVQQENKPLRLLEWEEFSKKVSEHIKNYTVPQYGDLNLEDPEKGDLVQRSSFEDIKHDLERYVRRMDSNQRGAKETKRDLVKIAHYAAIIDGRYERGEIQIDEVPVIELRTFDDLDESDILDQIHKYSLSGHNKIEILIK